MLYRSRGLLDLTRARERRNGQRGQVLVLFTLAIVLLMGLAAIVIDVGVLRTDGARLQNALDASSLAAGQSLPCGAGHPPCTAVTTVATTFTAADFPGAPAPTATYACLIGVDLTGLPRMTDIPAICKVSFPANSASWRCTGVVCWAPCNPAVVSTDVCNTIMLTDSTTRQYTFGRAIGIDSGSTGAVTAAACTGPCGGKPTVPVDVVVLLDRTGSMAASKSVGNLRAGALSVLSAFDPSIQRVALGFTGPSSITRVTGGYFGGPPVDPTSLQTNTCTSPYTVDALALSPGAQAAGPVPTYLGAAPISPVPSAASTTVVLPVPAGTVSGDFLLAGITVSGGNATTITPPVGWTLVRRTDSAANVSVAAYRKFAGGAEPATYTWTITSARASGGIVRYGGVDTTNPIDASPAGQNGNSTAVTAASVTTGVDKTAIVGLFATLTSATFTNPGLTEQVDVTNSNVAGPAIEIATGSQATAGPTGAQTATATASARWAAQLVTLRGIPGATDVYGINTTTDVGQWIPVGFSGIDTDSPSVVYNEAYVDAAHNPVAGTHIVEAIGCFDVSDPSPPSPARGVGTNLARPLYMATQYLHDYGRAGVKQGIIIETDGAPSNDGLGVQLTDYTTPGVLAAAQAAKDAGIEVYTVGYGVDNSTISLLANMATGPKLGGDTCTTAENTDGDHFFCQPIAGDLTSVLHAAAVALTGGTKLVQMYAQPIVSSVGPANGPKTGGTTVTITGKYFTEAYSVTFGGANAASFTVVSDTSITAVSPAGPAGTQVHIQVSTPGGSSKLVNQDRFTYGP